MARASAGQLLAAAEDPQRRPGLLLGLYDVLSNGQMNIWSAHRDEQRELESRPVGGSLPLKPEPYAGLVVNNAAGTKLDYYLDRTLDWRPGRCTAAGREVTVKAVLANSAPSQGLPTYVTDRLDKPPYATHEGDNRLLVSYYATAGADLIKATVDGRTALMSPGIERGHPVYTLDVEVPAGSSRTVMLHLLEPPADDAPTVLNQRLPRPLHATVHPSSGCHGGTERGPHRSAQHCRGDPFHRFRDPGGARPCLLLGRTIGVVQVVVPRSPAACSPPGRGPSGQGRGPLDRVGQTGGVVLVQQPRELPQRKGASEPMHRGEPDGRLAVLGRGAQHQFRVAHERRGEPSGGGSGGVPAQLGEQGGCGRVHRRAVHRDGTRARHPELAPGRGESEGQQTLCQG